MVLRFFVRKLPGVSGLEADILGTLVGAGLGLAYQRSENVQAGTTLQLAGGPTKVGEGIIITLDHDDVAGLREAMKVWGPEVFA